MAYPTVGGVSIYNREEVDANLGIVDA